MSLRDEIGDLVSEALSPDKTFDEISDRILALIDSQRCEWVKQADGGFLTSCRGYWLPGCWIADYPTDKCPCCGRKIEVKDATT